MSILTRLLPRRVPIVEKAVAKADVDGFMDMARMIQTSYEDAAANIKSEYMASLGEVPVATSRDLAELYSKSVPVYACANYIGMNLALVEYEIQTPKGVRVDTPMQKVFETDFRNQMLRNSISMSFKGASLSRVIRSGGFPSRLRWINFNLWQRQFWMDSGRLRGFTISRDRDNLDLPTYLALEDAFYITGIDLLNDFDGVSPAEVSFLHAGVTVEIASTQLRFFQNSAVPAMHFQPTEDVNWRPQPEDKDDLVNSLRKWFKGSANAFRSLVTPHRWEVKQYQADFDKLDMTDLHEQADEQVFMAFMLPKELLSPSSSGYASAYEARRGWLETFLKPQAEKFADQFTEQIVRPYNTKWKVVPKFDKVPGFRLDIAQRTETASKALNATLVSLYDAVKTVGVTEAPEEFKGIWLINGKPIPQAEIPLMYQKEQERAEKGMEIKRMGGLDGGRDVRPQNKKKEPRPTEGENPLPKQAERPTSRGSTEAKSEFMPDAIFKEYTNWKALATKGRDFEIRLLPADTGAFGKFLLTTGVEIDPAFEQIRADWHYAKGFSDTTTRYRSALYGLLTDAFSEKISRKEFGDLGRAEISQAFKSAFFDGLREGGNEVDELEDEDQAVLSLETKTERSYFTGFANDIFKTAVPLLKEAKAARAAGQPEADSLFDKFNTLREQMITRLDKWVNALRDINAKGLLAANGNQMLLWEYGQTLKHCDTCKAANGQVHTARKWKKKGLNPGVHTLYCHGDNCDCRFKPVKGKEKGDINAIPMHADEE